MPAAGPAVVVDVKDVKTDSVVAVVKPLFSNDLSKWPEFCKAGDLDFRPRVLEMCRALSKHAKWKDLMSHGPLHYRPSANTDWGKEVERALTPGVHTEGSILLCWRYCQYIGSNGWDEFTSPQPLMWAILYGVYNEVEASAKTSGLIEIRRTKDIKTLFDLVTHKNYIRCTPKWTQIAVKVGRKPIISACRDIWEVTFKSILLSTIQWNLEEKKNC